MNMRFSALKKCLSALLGVSLIAAATASTAASPKIGISVADYMLTTWPELDDATCGSHCFSLDYTTVPARPVPKYWEYTNGIPLVGIWKMYEKTGNVKYYDYVKKWVDTFVDASGNIRYGRPSSAEAHAAESTIQDVIQPSMLLFGLYEKTKDPRYLTAMANQRAVFDKIQKNPQGAFWHKPNYANQQWLDGIYMSEPFLAKYAHLYADQAIPGDAIAAFNTVTTQIRLIDENTAVPTKKLYVHAWNGAPDGVWLGLDHLKGRVPPLTSERATSVLWSRSICWYYLGIIDVLDDLPKAHPDRPRLVQIIKDMSAAIAQYQDKKTGLWNQVIDVTNDHLPAQGGYPTEPTVKALPNWNETSATALFAYGFAKAVRTGLIPRHYKNVAKKAWAGVKTQIDIAGNDVKIHGTVVGMSVGGTYNAYVNADFRTDNATGPLPAPTATCAPSLLPPRFTSPPNECRFLYVRDNVPQAFGAVLLAASEME